MKKMVVCPICGTKYGKVDELKGLELVCFKCKSELIANVTSTGVMVEVMNEVAYTDTDKPAHRTIPARA